VIPMPNSFENVTFLVGDQYVANGMLAQRTFQPFENFIIDFLDEFSRRLFRNPIAKAWPDVITLAFWCRKKALLKQKSAYPDLSRRTGRGLAFHIAPSNVATNFAWSLVAGLLSGNCNLVRVPSRSFPQVSVICEELNNVLRNRPDIVPYLCLVRYARESGLTDIFSGWCDTRLIWGGDETISAVRKSPIPSRSLDLTFTKRHSLMLIDASHYLTLINKRAVADGFYNDTYLMDQNACTSPQLVVWLGTKADKEQARTHFWAELEILVNKRYQLQPITALRKFDRFCHHAAMSGSVKKASTASNLIFRLLLDKLDKSTMTQTEAGGYFLEYLADDISEILPVCGNRCQTLAFSGVSSKHIEDFLKRYRPAGVDRVVPLGQTLDFNLKWDGYDLIYSLSRYTTFAD